MGAILSIFLRKIYTIYNGNATVTGQINIQGNRNTVHNYYPATKDESELADFNFPKPIDSFKGREDEYKQLDECLFLNNKKMVVIWGLPGFGKSEFLKKFAHKCKLKNKVKYICWIQASNKDILKHSLQNLVRILKLPEVDDLRVLLQTVSNRYQNSETLFVFDDADILRNLLDWETPSSCWTLVSSKFGEWGTMPSIELGPLDREAAVAVLQYQQDPAEIADSRPWSDLAELLGDAPLALQLAAAYIRQETKLFPKDFSILKYIKTLKKSRWKLLNEPVPSFLPYEYCIQKAINLSIEKIRGSNKFESNLALDILNILAYLDPYQILENLLLEFSVIQNKLKEEEDEEEEQEPGKEVRRALYVLQSYSFVHLEGSNIRIHSLVQHTLIFYHNKSNANMESYYTSCLEYALNNFNWNTISILEKADMKLKIFKIFYREYKLTIISENNNNNLNLNFDWCIPVNISDENFQMKIMYEKVYFIYNFSKKTFLEQLVVIGAGKCLDHIFSELGLQAKRVIIEHQLIYSAIDSREPNMLKLLQKYEEDIINFSVLHNSFSVSNLDILNLILEHSNIDLNALDDKGGTCIFFAFVSSIGNTEEMICQVLRTLVARGASVYNVTKWGWSLLHVAVHFIYHAVYLKVVEFIVDELQVDVNTRGTYDMTALHLILYRRVLQDTDEELTGKLVDVLVRRGASVHIKNNNGVTPLDIINCHKFHFLYRIVNEQEH